MTAKQIVGHFNKLVPDVKCELQYSTPYQLLVAVILSAQCTDKRVNMVTNQLFKIAPDPQSILKLGREKLEEIIHPCGFFRNKSANIISATGDIISKFNGVVPQEIDKLTSLAGVGRKTANVIISEAFGGDAFAVDTHVLRVSNRLGLVNSNDPVKVEQTLTQFFDKKDWSRLHYQMVLFGRYKCKAIKPECNGCPFQNICKYYQEKYVSRQG